MKKHTSSPLYQHKFHKGFSLIEMMIVVAIIGILSAIALPSYDNYITKARLSEAMVFLERAKLSVNIYYKDDEPLSALNNSAAAFSALGLKKMINTELLDQYWIRSWGGHDITIWARTQADSPLPSNADFKWPFYLAGNVNARGDLVWECRSDYHGSSLSKYAPTQCK